MSISEKVPILKYSAILFMIFILTAIFGYISGSVYPERADEFVDRLFEGFKFIDFSNPLEVLMVIFLNNTSKTLISILAGFFFGIFPVIFVALNGYIIGIFVFSKGGEIGIEKVIATLIPHGILEIPGIILGSAYGLWLGNLFYRYVVKNERDIDLIKAIRYSLKKFVKIVVPLLFIAAIVETFVSPLVPVLLFGMD
jgi:stage II sporulation protein M